MLSSKPFTGGWAHHDLGPLLLFLNFQLLRVISHITAISMAWYLPLSFPFLSFDEEPREQRPSCKKRQVKSCGNNSSSCKKALPISMFRLLQSPPTSSSNCLSATPSQPPLLILQVASQSRTLLFLQFRRTLLLFRSKVHPDLLDATHTGIAVSLALLRRASRSLRRGTGWRHRTRSLAKTPSLSAILLRGRRKDGVREEVHRLGGFGGSSIPCRRRRLI